MAAMKTAADEAKLKALNAMTYKEQGKWFLNSFWADMYESAPEKAEEQVPRRLLQLQRAHCLPAPH